METNNDEEVILNTQEETTDSNDVDTDESSEESIEEVKSRLAKAEELAQNYKIRAEKAEKRTEKTETTKVAPKKSSDLSAIDIIAITKANIDVEDIAVAEKYARFEGISIAEALKTPELRSILNVKAEQRTTAQATSTGATRRGSSRISDDQLLANASNGRLPESDEDIARLIEAKMKRK